MNEKNYFIKKLEGLFDPLDRGTLANLRRTAGSENYEAYKFMPDNIRANSSQEKAALIIAPLFALWHQGKDKPKQLNDSMDYQDRKNLGFSFALLAWHQADNRISEWKNAKERLEKRFNAMLSCHIDDLATHLRHVVSLLKVNDIAINWEQLYKDIQGWGHSDQYVQKNWSRSFWAISLKAEN